MAKVKFLTADYGKKGDVGYLSYHEMMNALQAGAIEVINEAEEQAKTGSETDKAEIDVGADSDLDGMTKAELEAEAERRGVDVSSARTKHDILSVLKNA